MKLKITGLLLAAILILPSSAMAHGRGRHHSQNKGRYQNTQSCQVNHRHNRKTGECNYGEYCLNNHKYNKKTKVCNYGEDCPYCVK